jgi:hypothetical protein
MHGTPRPDTCPHDHGVDARPILLDRGRLKSMPNTNYAFAKFAQRAAKVTGSSPAFTAVCFLTLVCGSSEVAAAPRAPRGTATHLHLCGSAKEP